jgi:CubicO group peptidase (beta-lactamase class C family)
MDFVLTAQQTARGRRARSMIALLAVATAVACGLLLHQLPIATGYAAKVLCSGVFVAGRSQTSLLAEDLGGFAWLRSRVDPSERSASSDWLGLARSTAVYRDGLGCALAVDASAAELRAQGFEPNPTPDHAGMAWPLGDRVDPATPDGFDAPALAAAVDAAFGERDPAVWRRTRALVVLHRGRLVAERYAPGFNSDTPLLGWSMTKSVLAALIGIQAGRGQIELDAPAPVASWRSDARAAITPDDLLRMTSGLEFSERYGAFADATAMLFLSRSTSAYAERKPLAHPPGSVWSYSSGSSNLLSGILRESFAGNTPAYHRFPREALFDRIGMRSAVLETDAAGTFVASSFAYATARDWARFGLLHAQDGVWRGERVLPIGWVARIRQPTPPAPQGSYGAHWWLNAGTKGAPEDRPFPSLPADLYFASGFEAQYLVVLPSHELVVVRLGQSEPEEAFDLESFLVALLAAFPASPARP